MHKSFSEKFGSHIPANSWAIVNKWFAQEDLAFRLSRSRAHQAGRLPLRSKKQVERCVREQRFESLFFSNYANSRVRPLSRIQKILGEKLAPHGLEWKRTFGELLIQLNDLKCFPEDLSPLVIKHSKKAQKHLQMGMKNFIEHF